MNERIKALMLEAGYAAPEIAPRAQLLAELIVKSVLDEVEQRAYVSGDRAWSDQLDRPWVELAFGLGPLADLKQNN